MKKDVIPIITIVTLAIYLSAFFVMMAFATKSNDDATKPIGLACEKYVCDVVDETDFWFECDSTAFNKYEENTTEWYMAVVMEYLNQTK